jgi:hypothetical protein
MNFDSFEEIIGACGVVTTAGMRAADGFEDGIAEFLVTADDPGDEQTEHFCKQIHGRYPGLGLLIRWRWL